MTFVEQALALFENGVPTLEAFTEKVWQPSRNEALGTDAKVLEAIKHYVDAYNALTSGHINSAYGFLFGRGMNVKDSLPKSLDLNILIEMHDAIVAEKEQRREQLVASRSFVLSAGTEKLKEALKQIGDELEKDGLEIYISGRQDIISVEDKHTGKSMDLYIDSLDD